MIDRDQLRRGPEPYLGWWLEGAPGPVGEPTSYVCYANEDRGEGRFRVNVDCSMLHLPWAERYAQGTEVAFHTARGLLFVGTWRHDDECVVTLPYEPGSWATVEIRNAIIRGLYRLYEAGYQRQDVVVDFEGVALALGVSELLVTRAAEFLHDVGLVTDEPAVHGRNWSTGSIWLTAAGVQYAESLPPVPTVQAMQAESMADDPEQQVWDWDLFIAHASEDKKAVARPLHRLLTGEGLRVWLDENELRVGDSLRRKIDHGLAHSRHGLVVLSQHFFEKNWPQQELDGLTALQKRILPVWHGVDRDDVAAFSPMLAGIFAVRTANGLDHVVSEILKAMA